ncbi:hypothetical protein EV12_1563 [Prochlorococcus sp. MIT 0701]|nr:hypothetical protein EV12_1563 [Prochlorococcus sp. MIT 0701]
MLLIKMSPLLLIILTTSDVIIPTDLHVNLMPVFWNFI